MQILNVWKCLKSVTNQPTLSYIECLSTLTNAENRLLFAQLCQHNFVSSLIWKSCVQHENFVKVEMVPDHRGVVPVWLLADHNRASWQVVPLPCTAQLLACAGVDIIPVSRQARLTLVFPARSATAPVWHSTSNLSPSLFFNTKALVSFYWYWKIFSCASWFFLGGYVPS